MDNMLEKYRERQRLEAEICFPVEEAEVQTTMQVGGGVMTVPSPRHTAIVRTDTNEVVAINSDRYELIPNSDILGAVTRSFERAGMRADLAKAHLENEGRRFFVEYHFPEISFTPSSDGKPMIYRLLVGGSYDGTKRVWIQAGAFRLVCSNGMMIGTVDMTIAQRHVGSSVQDIPARIQEELPGVFREAATQMSQALAPIWNSWGFRQGSAIRGMIQDARITDLDHVGEVVTDVFKLMPVPVARELGELVGSNTVPEKAEGDIMIPRNFYNLATHLISDYSHGKLTESRRMVALDEVHKRVTRDLVAA